MSYLFGTYKNLHDQSLNEAHQKMISQIYVHSDTIANVFNTTCNYVVISTSQGTPKIDTQLISIGKIIITNTGIFSEYVEHLNAIPWADQT